MANRNSDIFMLFTANVPHFIYGMFEKASEFVMTFLPRFLCQLIGHRRSRSRAYLDPSEKRWRSYCRRCRTPMRKNGLLGWQECLES